MSSILGPGQRFKKRRGGEEDNLIATSIKKGNSYARGGGGSTRGKGFGVHGNGDLRGDRP